MLQPERYGWHPLFLDKRNDLRLAHVIDQFKPLLERILALAEECFVLASPAIVGRAAYARLFTGDLDDRHLLKCIDERLLICRHGF